MWKQKFWWQVQLRFRKKSGRRQVRNREEGRGRGEEKREKGGSGVTVRYFLKQQNKGFSNNLRIHFMQAISTTQNAILKMW